MPDEHFDIDTALKVIHELAVEADKIDPFPEGEILMKDGFMTEAEKEILQHREEWYRRHPDTGIDLGLHPADWLDGKL